MVFILLLAHAWALTQIALLTAPWRTVGMRTIALAFCAGFGVAAPLVLFIQWAWINAYQEISDTPSFLAFTLVETAGYTVDPFLEEIGKLLPLILLMVLPRTKYRLGLSDSLIIGAALGAGFGFAEETMRITQWVSERGLHWSSYDEAWTIPFFLSTLRIPGPLQILTSWIPNPMQFDSHSFEWLGNRLELVDFSRHLVWSAIAGLGVGILFRVRSPLRWLGGLLWLWASLDHVFVNYILSNTKISEIFSLSAIFSALTGFGQFATLALAVSIVAACWLDAKTQYRILLQAPDLWLEDEKRRGFPLGTFLAFLRHPLHYWGTIKQFIRDRNGWLYSQEYLTESTARVRLGQELLQTLVQINALVAPPQITRERARASLLLLPLVSLIVALIYFITSSIIADKNTIRLIKNIIILPSVILSILCFIRLVIYLYYFHKNYSITNVIVPVSKSMEIVFAGLLLHSSIILLIYTLIRIPTGLNDPLIAFHITDAASNYDILELALTSLAFASMTLTIFNLFGLITVPFAVTLALQLPSILYSISSFITGQKFILTNKLEFKSENSNKRDFYDLILDIIGILPLNRVTGAIGRVFRQISKADKVKPISNLIRSLFVKIPKISFIGISEKIKHNRFKRLGKKLEDLVSLILDIRDFPKLIELSSELTEGPHKTQQSTSSLELEPPQPLEPPKPYRSSRPLGPPEPPRPPEPPKPPQPPEPPEPPQPPEPLGPPEPSVPPGSLDDLLSRADSLIECGEALLEQNRLTEAESAFNQALELYQQALQQAAQNQDLVDQAQAWQGIGKTLLLLERLEEAKQALDAALGLYRQLSIRGEPLIKLLITAIEAERKSGHFELIPDLALEAINEAKALPNEEQVIMLQLLEKKFTRLNLLEWAERCLTRN